MRISKTGDPTFIVYIDESGDEGFTFRNPGEGSSEWFVNSAIIVRKSVESTLAAVVPKAKALLKKPARKPLHFRDLNHAQRKPYITDLAAQSFRAISIMVHKPSIADPSRFRNGHRLYWYSTRFLLERVSWYCRDIRTSQDQGDGSANIYFSHRRSMSYQELDDYLAILEGRDDVTIDWSVVRRDQIAALPHDQRKGLQLVDAVASATWMALEIDPYGGTEDAYARALEDRWYHHRLSRRGYGLKVWPREADTIVATEDRFQWLRDALKKK